MATPERGWFLTLNGEQFFYDEPEAYPYDIVEIAHVLGKACRFANHLRCHYSVGTHSVLVAQTVRWLIGREDDRLFRAAMLHDASEAFLLDIPRPLKRLPAMDPYRDLEDRVQRAIMRHFGLEDLHEHPIIKRADAAMLQTEKIALRPPSRFRQEYDDRETSPIAAVPMSEGDARDLFLAVWGAHGG